MHPLYSRNATAVAVARAQSGDLIELQEAGILKLTLVGAAGLKNMDSCSSQSRFGFTLGYTVSDKRETKRILMCRCLLAPAQVHVARTELFPILSCCMWKPSKKLPNGGFR
jgi:hypothetical protein